MKRAILYCRVSTEEQTHGYSLSNQEEQLHKFCNDHQIEVLETYREDHSAKSFDRPVFQRQLLPFVKKNHQQLDHLLVLKWDRFSRDITDALVWIREFQSWGIQVDATEQRVDLSVPQNKYMLAFYLTHPEVENDIRTANTREGMSKALKEGRWVSRPSIGYRMERDATGKPNLVTDDQAPFVREAFLRIATGRYAYTEVFNHLTERGFRCKRNQFYRMLAWYPYCGLIPVTDQSGLQDFVIGVHEPIVSEELFHRVQAVRQERRNRGKRKKTKLRPEFPLRGHIVCQDCGNLLTASTSVGRFGRRYAYYHCHRGCKQRHRAESVNDGVVAYLGSFEVDPGMAELYQTIFQDLFAERSRNQVQETASLDRDIDQVEARILVAAEKLVEGELDTEVYRSLKDEYDRRRSALVARRADLGDSSAERLQYVQSGLNLLTNLSSHYKSADVSGKHLLLGSIFPKNLSFDGRSFRTERPNTFVDLICKGQNDLRTIKRKGPPKNGGPSYMVARTGFEPVLMP